MSIHTIKKQLRQLPYIEMKALAMQINQELDQRSGLHTIEKVADILTSLPLEDERIIKMEQQYLSEVFSRKRNITVAPTAGGWTFSVSGSEIFESSPDIREGLSMLLEGIATLRAMGEK